MNNLGDLPQMQLGRRDSVETQSMPLLRGSGRQSRWWRRPISEESCHPHFRWASRLQQSTSGDRDRLRRLEIKRTWSLFSLTIGTDHGRARHGRRPCSLPELHYLLEKLASPGAECAGAC
ncbi:hypothetical protein VTK73DRAFT_6633 [Phialemonium thermophilum]|uniref:Uncharacterized protein n=1 Tax=Phialemonium thermophilum TaxID=223376 RepID=A0ABR3XWE0_9PEZI